jgi:hypothetical protein
MTENSLRIPYRTVAAFGLGATAVLLALFLASLAGASAPAAGLAIASPPQVVSYQGTVEVSGAPYHGTGFFKFALVDAASGDGSGNYWANDGTASGEPSQTVPLSVADGLFTVLLGDTGASGMTTPLSDGAFSSSDAYLRIWFSQELSGPFDALEPNQRIGSVPYALRAAYAESGSAMVPAGAVMFFDAGSCPAGWSELTQARGRAVVGLPSGGALLGTQGSALTNLENRTHTHSVNPPSANTSTNGSHTHDTGEPTRKGGVGLTTGGFIITYGEDDHLHNVTSGGSHNHSVNLPGTESTTAATGDVMPYIQLLACRKD